MFCNWLMEWYINEFLKTSFWEYYYDCHPYDFISQEKLFTLLLPTIPMNPNSSNSPLKLETSIKTNKYFANKTNTCEYIVLHHTGKGDDMSLVKYLALNAAQVSCHYVITTSGVVYKIAEDRQCTWHAGTSNRQ